MIKALIFDFDGLILDTEGPDYGSWQQIFDSYNCILPMAKWQECIGSADTFDPYDYLASQLGAPVDRDEVRQRRRRIFAEMMEDQDILPGVAETILEAKEYGLKLAVASSSPHSWVDNYLSDLGLQPFFDTVICADDVPRAKPDPALYLTALQWLDIAPNEAIALEDSPHGVTAAQQAGIFCIAIPNGVTRQLSLDAADLQLSSMAELSLPVLLPQFSVKH